MTKTTKKVSKPEFTETKIHDLTSDPRRVVMFKRRVYRDGRETFILWFAQINVAPKMIELEKPELTELLVQAFEYLKSPKLINELKMPTEMKQ